MKGRRRTCRSRLTGSRTQQTKGTGSDRARADGRRMIADDANADRWPLPYAARRTPEVGVCSRARWATLSHVTTHTFPLLSERIFRSTRTRHAGPYCGQFAAAIGRARVLVATDPAPEVRIAIKLQSPTRDWRVGGVFRSPSLISRTRSTDRCSGEPRGSAT